MTENTIDYTFNKAEVATRIKSRREQLGLYQKFVAQASGLKQSAYSHIENGRNTPTIENLIAIASVLNVDITYLLGLEKEAA